jgi:hypothetical protein
MAKEARPQGRPTKSKQEEVKAKGTHKSASSARGGWVESVRLTVTTR